MNAPLIATVGHGATSLWYLTRATGLVALIVLSSTVVLGIVSSVGWTTERWPRFLSQAVHRNLSLFCLALVFIHVATTVADGYVPIGFADAVIPFRSPYRPIWVGLGACAFDVLLAVAVTSGLRRHIGFRTWRWVHWLAYLCWPVALIHGLGTGSDTRLPGVQFVYLLCVVAVIGALGWRLVTARALTSGWRIGAAVGATFVLLGTAVFAFTGPLQAGWSRRSGTSSAVLAKIDATASASVVPSSGQASSSSTTLPAGAPAASPSTPFSSALDGTYSVSSPDGAGQVQVQLSMRLATGGLALVVDLAGPAVNGGVAMTSSQVTFGTRHGQVTFLDGSTIDATVSGSGGSENLTMRLELDRAAGTVSGTMSGAAGSQSSDGKGDSQ
jgi:sulfoxide reductase heme-binding subunit YedZ